MILQNIEVVKRKRVMLEESMLTHSSQGPEAILALTKLRSYHLEHSDRLHNICVNGRKAHVVTLLKTL